MHFIKLFSVQKIAPRLFYSYNQSSNCRLGIPAQHFLKNNVFIGPNCSFYCAQHPLSINQRNKGLEYAKPITVGDNVWFGGNVTVLSGITIGNGAVIGAGSVITKDVPDNVVVAGNPAKIIKVIDQNE